jgi:hypothetical protein
VDVAVAVDVVASQNILAVAVDVVASQNILAVVVDVVASQKNILAVAIDVVASQNILAVVIAKEESRMSTLAADVKEENRARNITAVEVARPIQRIQRIPHTRPTRLTRPTPMVQAITQPHPTRIATRHTEQATPVIPRSHPTPPKGITPNQVATHRQNHQGANQAKVVPKDIQAKVLLKAKALLKVRVLLKARVLVLVASRAKAESRIRRRAVVWATQSHSVGSMQAVAQMWVAPWERAALATVKPKPKKSRTALTHLDLENSNRPT